MEPKLKDAEMTDAGTHPPAGCISADYYSCEEAVKRLNEYLDHEMNAEDRVVVLHHLEICRSCLTRFSFEQTLVVSLRQKVLLLCAPPTLREKLHALLHGEEPTP